MIDYLSFDGTFLCSFYDSSYLSLRQDVNLLGGLRLHGILGRVDPLGQLERTTPDDTLTRPECLCYLTLRRRIKKVLNVF